MRRVLAPVLWLVSIVFAPVRWLLWPFKYVARKLRHRSERRRVSICGPDDRQHVEQYDGTLGPSKELVARLQSHVGQLLQCGNRSCQIDGGARFCSGALFARDLFITAGHCVGTPLEELLISFNYQLDPDGNPRKETRYRVLEVVETGEKHGLDYAIYRLDGSPGDEWGYAPLAAANAKPGDLLTVIQHPNAEPKQVEAGPCLGIEGQHITYNDIDTMGGSSGSAVFGPDGLIVGVHTNGGCRIDGSGYNFGTAIEAILEVSEIARSHTAQVA